MTDNDCMLSSDYIVNNMHYDNGGMTPHSQFNNQGYTVSVVDAGSNFPVQSRDFMQRDTNPGQNWRLGIPPVKASWAARSPSPNHDSAIENVTPSMSDCSDKGSYRELKHVVSPPPRGFRPPLTRAQTEPPSMVSYHLGHLQDVTLSQINIHEALETLNEESCKNEWLDSYDVNKASDRRMYHDEPSQMQTLYQAYPMDSLSVSQI